MNEVGNISDGKIACFASYNYNDFWFSNFLSDKAFIEWAKFNARHKT